MCFCFQSVSTLKKNSQNFERNSPSAHFFVRTEDEDSDFDKSDDECLDGNCGPDFKVDDSVHARSNGKCDIFLNFVEFDFFATRPL